MIATLKTYLVFSYIIRYLVYYHDFGLWIMSKYAVFFSQLQRTRAARVRHTPFRYWRERQTRFELWRLVNSDFSTRELIVAISRVIPPRDILPPTFAMSRLYQPSDHVVEKSYICSLDKYREMHKKSLEDPESFWSEIANEFHWQTPYQSGNFVSYNFDTNKGNVFVKWLEGAVTNVCFNALDRNVRNGHGDKIAFYW